MKFTVSGFVALLLVGVTGCGFGKALQDDAACPGATCTADAQERYDAVVAVVAVDGVIEVGEVSRSYGLDSGSTAHAEVRARVQDRESAYDVAVEVLGELDDWPDHEFSVAEVKVVADPAVETDYVSRADEDLTNPYFKQCAPLECERALGDLRDRMLAEIDGLREVRAEVEGGVLRIAGTTDPDQYALAAAGAHGLVFDTALRLADRLEVEMRARGPLTVTLRLQGGLVCEQPPGTTSRCERDYSEPFENS